MTFVSNALISYQNFKFGGALKLFHFFLSLRLTPALLLIVLLGCGNKTPLVESYGYIEIPGAYFNTEENVAYLFFEIHENPALLENMVLQIEIQQQGSSSILTTRNWRTLDLSTGVHQHTMMNCGQNARCGSYSWRTTTPFEMVHLRMLYHPEGTINLTTLTTTRSMSQPSAVLFGVFDESNQHMQVRLEDNFGIPSRLDSPKYGMRRRVAVRAPANAQIAKADMQNLASQIGDNYLYPASFCPSQATGQTTKTFVGYQSWINSTFEASPSHNGVCFTADLTDKDGNILVQHEAFARRNPKFILGQYKFNTPLTEATKIPIVVAYCADATGSSSARNADFFDYQRNIIGFESLSEDICFTVSDATMFRSRLQQILASKLAQAKSAATKPGDFIFTIVLHQNLTYEFRVIHQIIAEEATALIKNEEPLSSPRLAGAFVYDSRSDYRPTSEQEARIIWCPQERPKDPARPQTSSPANCLVEDPLKIGGQVLNFSTSLGPFPTLSSYSDYVSTIGDRGLAKKPDLTFASVPQNGSTFVESSGTKTTYFDSERLVIGTDQYARICHERDPEGLLSSIRMREDSQSTDTPGITVSQAESAWQSGVGQGSYRLGVTWEVPFIGKVTYRSSIQGTFVSLIPFGRSFNSYRILGESKWLQDALDLGRLIQVCSLYCDHPYFDDAGTYQVTVNYRNQFQTGCVSPKYPVYGEE